MELWLASKHSKYQIIWSDEETGVTKKGKEKDFAVQEHSARFSDLISILLHQSSQPSAVALVARTRGVSQKGADTMCFSRQDFMFRKVVHSEECYPHFFEKKLH